VARRYEELVAREFWSAQQWLECQDDLLRRFVAHCYDHSAFHRQRFDGAGLKPSDIRTAADLAKLPVLSKMDVRGNVKALLAGNFNQRKLKVGHTSGSTGAPLTFYAETTVTEYTEAGLWRNFSRCGWQPGEKIAGMWGLRPSSVWAARLRKALCNLIGLVYLSAWKVDERDFADWLRLLRRTKPTVLVAFGSIGGRFANWLIEHNESVPSIKGVYTTSEKLYESQRQALVKAFGCKVFDYYGCQEVPHIACQCEQGRMHVHPDMVVAENGPADELGQRPLIVTGLRNWAMPFLRYVPGDTGLLPPGDCPCGRRSPLMELQISRVSDVFRFPDGKVYPSLYFVVRLQQEGFDGLELYQFHQDKPDHIYLRIVRNARFDRDTEKRVQAAARQIESDVTHQATVEVVYVDYIDQSATNKHYYARSDVK
jgi:phenylacetate-CoA ligase